MPAANVPHSQDPDSPVLFFVTIDVERGWEEEFDCWNDEEHVPALLRVPGFRAARRYRSAGDPQRFLGMYELASLTAYESPERAAVMETERTWRIAPHVQAQRVFAQGVADAADGGPPIVGADAVTGLFSVPLARARFADRNFRAWFRETHVAAMAELPEVLAVRLFEPIQPEIDGLLIHYLAGAGPAENSTWRGICADSFGLAPAPGRPSLARGTTFVPR